MDPAKEPDEGSADLPLASRTTPNLPEAQTGIRARYPTTAGGSAPRTPPENRGPGSCPRAPPRINYRYTFTGMPTGTPL